MIAVQFPSKTAAARTLRDAARQYSAALDAMLLTDGPGKVAATTAATAARRQLLAEIAEQLPAVAAVLAGGAAS